MSLDETVNNAVPLESSLPLEEKRIDQRVRVAMRHPHNWLQLCRFAVVGASGYVVNLIVFGFMLEFVTSVRFFASATAFVISLANNFFWNRRWTFAAKDQDVGFQAARFFVVSVCAFVLAYLLLELLAAGMGLPNLLAQAIALVIVTPLNFLGNRLWSFASR
jgi:putative flippase GtrA